MRTMGLISRRRFTAMTAIAGALTMLSFGAQAQSKTVYLLSWGGTIQTTFEKEGWAQRFKDDTGYEVVLVPKATTSEIMATALAQKDNPQVDVVMCDYAGWILGTYQGLFGEVDLESVPNIAELYDYAPIKDGDKIIGSYTYTDTLGIIYQPEMFEKNGWAAPTGWDDLFRPEFDGKIAIPPVSNTYGMYTLVHFARAGGGGAKNIDPGFEALKKLAPGVLDWSTTYAQIGSHMQSESVAIAVFGANSGHEIKARGIPAEVIIPEPNYLSATAVGVVANSPNPEGARVLMNWILGEDFQQMRAERFGNNAMNKNVEVTGEAAERLLSKEQLESLVTLDYPTILESRDEWNLRFEKEIAPIR